MTGRVAIASAPLRRDPGSTWRRMRRGWSRKITAVIGAVLTATAPMLASKADESTAAAAPSGYTVSFDQIDHALTQRFPLRLSAGGLLLLTLAQPKLRPLTAANRMQASMVMTVAGPALARSATGQLDLDFGLRYERRDRTLRAHDVRVKALRIADLPPPYPELVEGVSQALADRSLGEVVLHRLGARELALPDAMGLEPGTFTVTAAGLVIGFAAKAPR